MSNSNIEFILASISKVETDYYSKIKNIVDNTVITDFISYVFFSEKISQTYFDTCAQLLGIHIEFKSSTNKDIFNFDTYVEKRRLLKNHNDSILDHVFSSNL
jgi:hypothetical protein